MGIWKCGMTSAVHLALEIRELGERLASLGNVVRREGLPESHNRPLTNAVTRSDDGYFPANSPPQTPGRQRDPDGQPELDGGHPLEHTARLRRVVAIVSGRPRPGRDPAQPSAREL